MATIKNLKPGLRVWSVQTVRSTVIGLSRKALYPVDIVEVHNNHVIASWNGNSPKRFNERNVKKWRVNNPKLHRDETEQGINGTRHSVLRPAILPIFALGSSVSS